MGPPHSDVCYQSGRTYRIRDSIRLDLHDELGRPLAWDKDTIQKPKGHLSLQDKGISYGLPDNHITQQCE